MGSKKRGFWNITHKLKMGFSEVSCGHLREPVLQRGRTITGYCSLLRQHCEYQVPFVSCQERKDYFNSPEYAAEQEKIEDYRLKLLKQSKQSPQENSEELDRLIGDAEIPLSQPQIIQFPKRIESRTTHNREPTHQKPQTSKKPPIITMVDIRNRFARNSC